MSKAITFKSTPEADTNGTSFHDNLVFGTLDEMKRKLGEPAFLGSADDKTQYEWVFTSDDGQVVTVYDWKEYGRQPKEWHVGGLERRATERFVHWFGGLK